MTDSTDNARGPERIFAWKYSGQHTEGQWRSSLGACPTKGYVCCEYIRADLAPDPLGAVKVKPLEWLEKNAVLWVSSGYEIINEGELGFCLYGEKYLSRHETLEAAKAAAQQDYETRIRSALEPDPQDVRVAALVDAAQEVHDDLLLRGLDKDDPETKTPYRQVSIGRSAWSGLCAALAAFDKGGKDE